MTEQVDRRQRTNVSNRLFGSYPAQVVNTEHPDGLYMVSVRVLGLWDSVPDKDLPYAEFLLPLGAKPEHGHAVPVEPQDLVWVEFPRNGDTRYPLITGSVYHAPSYQSNLPKEVNGQAYETKRSPNEPTPPAYDRKDDLYERWGLREHKTHAGGWSITHVATGSAVEITPDGQVVIHVEGDSFQSATGKHLGQFGTLDILVKGDASVKCDGNGKLESKGDMDIKSGGNMNLDAKGELMFKGSKIGGKTGSMYDFK